MGIVPLAGRGSRKCWSIRVADTGEVTAQAPGRDALEAQDVVRFAMAFRLLADQPLDLTALPAPDTAVVEAIVRPPGRLLSETTSKRLLAAFGITPPREQLCESATEAVRFAASLDGPAVLKLVKPALENKRDLGAVRIGVLGPSAVRREVHSLRSLGQKLGRPSALGVLVAQQISGGARIWLSMEDHPIFGRILRVGPGDDPLGTPAFVVSAPVDERQALKALSMVGIGATAEQRKLGQAIAACSRMADSLGQRIDQLEIHPLVALPGREAAIALDGLVGIGGRGAVRAS
jgi:acetyltransferase